jgi:DNA replication protein DnaC
MTSTSIELLQQQMRMLKLAPAAEELPGLLQEASRGEVAYAEFLAEVVARELGAKHERTTAMKTAMARFPFHKTIESFDFKFQPSIDVKVIRELATGRFIADASNALLLGPPGVGKTHLAVGIGLKACAVGCRTQFVTAAGLVASLARAHNENRLEEKLKQLVQPRLLVAPHLTVEPDDWQPSAAANPFVATPAS